MKTCPVCFSDKIKIKFNLYDDRYGYPGIFHLLSCNKCKHMFLDSDFTDQQLLDLYTTYYPRSNYNIEKYKPAQPKVGFRSWLNGTKRRPYTWVPKNVTVLDIGCGYGESIGYLESLGCQAYGIEADENIKKVIQKFGYKIHVGLFESNIFKPDFFDYVTMDQVFEHMQNPLETLIGIKKILKKNGVLIISFPNSMGWGARLFKKKWMNWHAPYRPNLFSQKSLDYLAKRKLDLRLKEL